MAKPDFFQHLFSLEKNCLENFWEKVEELEDRKLSDSPLTKDPLKKGVGKRKQSLSSFMVMVWNIITVIV